MNARILVLTTEPLPLPGCPTTGAGMRAWGLALGLRARGHRNVEIAFAADALRGREPDLSQIPGVLTFERSQLDSFIDSRKPDAVVFQHWGLVPELKRAPKCPVAIDLAGPHLLERRLWGSPDPEKDLRQKLAALAMADFTVCSGRFQRHYFLPFLVQAGHDPRASLCPVIPFSLSPDLPSAAPPDRDNGTFLFSGMFLPWQDPEATLRAVVKALEERQRGRLVFVGGPHPGGDVSGGRFDSLMEFLEGHPQVECHPVLPFEEVLGLMRRSSVAIDLMPRNAERELAFPTRTVTFLWAGLPVIHNNYDELAEPIERTKAGWTFDPADTDGVRRLVSRLVGHREDVERRAANAQKLVTDCYTWDRTIEPLSQWCENPTPRAGKRAAVIPTATAVAAPSAVSAVEVRPSAPARSTKRNAIRYAPQSPKSSVGYKPWYLSPVVFLLVLPISALLLLLFALAEIARMAIKGRDPLPKG